MSELELRNTESARKVTKGWGHELWLVPEGAPFAVLWYADGPAEPVTKRELREGDIVHVRPGALHRVEAITDIVLVEVSTPELDDVIRVADDFNRGNGRITAEHEEGR